MAFSSVRPSPTSFRVGLHYICRFCFQISLHLRFWVNRTFLGYCMPPCTWWWTHPIYAPVGWLPGGEVQPPPREQWQGGGAPPHAALSPASSPSFRPGLVPLEGRARWVSQPGPGVPGCGALGVLSLPGHLFAGLFPGWRQQKRSLKLEMDSRVRGRPPGGGAEPLWTGFWRSPGCQAGRRWHTETRSRLRAHSGQVPEALGRDTAGAAGAGCGVGEQPVVTATWGRRPSVDRC